MKVRRILVIANQTACSQPLLDMVIERIGDGSAQVTLLVPATHPGGQATWTEGGAHRAAEQRLREAADRFRSAGIEIQGVVGDANPVTAVGDLLIDRRFDEIVLSTLPPGVSRWLKMDAESRLAKRHGLPVTAVVGERTELAVG